MNKKTLIYDLPTRVFHWTFALLFLFAFVIAKTIDDESPVFGFHMLAGLTLSFAVILRIVWGFIGTRYAQFSNFDIKPSSLANYFKCFLSGKKYLGIGHNPATSVAALTMFTLALGLGLTGYLMTATPNKETFEDIHELMANAFIVIAILHVTGVILHTLRHKEIIALSMIHGAKKDVPEHEGIASPKTGMALFLLALVLAFGIYCFKNYDQNTKVLNFFGASLSLEKDDDKNESHEKSESKESKNEKDDDD